MSEPEYAETVEQAAETIRGFTPGPWAVGETRARRGVTVPWYETPVHVGEGKPARPNGNTIALVSLGGPGATSCAREDVEANARLIAAAPDILRERDALQAEVERLRAELSDARDAMRALMDGGGDLVGQRDALADALEKALPHFDSIWDSNEQRWVGGAPAEVWDAVREAMKLCGREAAIIALGRQE